MSRPPDVERRAELLAAVVASCAARGIGHRSLRDLAADAGTSHRMLLHHFGSREALLVAIVEEVERRQAEFATTLAGSPAEALLAAMWAHLSDPALRPFERLFFESYARGANGETPFDRLLPAVVDAWLQTDGPAHGPADRADAAPDPALTRLGLAVVRGLLLDLVATGAEAETTAALHRFAALLAAQPATATATAEISNR